jgi:hypothetical protein
MIQSSLSRKAPVMLFLPIVHNGQTFDLVPQDSWHGTFSVFLNRETFCSEKDAEQGCPEDISERLGGFTIDHYYERITAHTRYGYGVTVYSITEAVAHIADNYRACDHGDATGTGDPNGNTWNCDICGVDFTR